MQLSKTDFLQFLHCSKSLWLLRRKPTLYLHGPFSDYLQKIVSEGYEVELYLKSLLSSQIDSDKYSYQTGFKTGDGLYAIADCTRQNEDGSIDVYEVKSSTSVQRGAPQNQIKDASFQKIAAEGAGFTVARVFIVHLNSQYARNGAIDTDELLVFADVTAEVNEMAEQTKREIAAALSLLKSPDIDESSCSCLELTKSNHCDTFDYFNPSIPKPSIYNLPRISKTKLQNFVADGRFSLDDIALHEVTEKQSHVLRSAHLKEPVVDHSIISQWFSKLTYPVYFLDYETYASATPIINDARPHAPIPFQYSLHIKRSVHDDQLEHVEYLADEAVMPIAMIEHMEKHIGDVGSIVSWHASFENTQNRNMAVMYPAKHEFLYGLIERTVDLEDLFKEGYVDIKFQGSTSIKKVLPVLVPELDYAGMDVASGTDAMEAWQTLINMPPSEKRNHLKNSMLQYCALDTLAMVRIFEFINDF
ncbi:DUF2779 domain-containing protein [Planktomarina temperata]|nr:DUF2779 domain-containing protein [Planktomarina temperata]